MNGAALLDEARRNPNNLSFSKLCALVVAAGWVFRRQKGSHRIYTHTKAGVPMVNLQDRGGKAKPYQVKQVVGHIDAHNLL